MPALALTTLVVRSYEEALAFCTEALGLAVWEDVDLGDGKRWVVVGAAGGQGGGLLLAEASDAEQAVVIGRQAGGRVAFFLHTDDFAAQHSRMLNAGVRFTEEPRNEPYGTVAVFEDRYGNRWDLIEPRGPAAPDGPPDAAPHRAAHWEGVHAEKGAGEVSWWQEPDSLWLDLIERAGVSPADTVVDVGAGASLLVDALLEAGFSDVTVLDISASALDRVARRLGERAAGVRLVAGDVTAFRGERPYALWHDRAVFHFLVDTADRDAYRESLRANLAPGGLAVLAVFAPDGPETCSGLPVRRYDVPALVDEIGAGFTLVHGERRVHTTPWGAEQPFTVALLRRD